MDLTVEWLAKGQLKERIVRAWNPHAGTSCGGAFSRTEVGTEIVVALTPMSPAAEDELYWRTVGFKPPLGDYLISGPCTESFLVLRTPQERSRYIGKAIP